MESRLRANILSKMTMFSSDFQPKMVRYSNTAPRFQFNIFGTPCRHRHLGRYFLTDAGTRAPPSAPERAPMRRAKFHRMLNSKYRYGKFEIDIRTSAARHD